MSRITSWIQRIGDAFELRLTREEFEAIHFATSLAVVSILLPGHPDRELLEDLKKRMELAGREQVKTK